MPSRRLTESELEVARGILDQVRETIAAASKGDPVLTFALRRYVYKYLTYDERGTPAARTKLKMQKLLEQDGKCGYEKCPVPDRKITKADEPELNRIDPVQGYTSENSVLVHHACHRMSQSEKGFA
jgi:hypothetical protein